VVCGGFDVYLADGTSRSVHEVGHRFARKFEGQLMRFSTGVRVATSSKLALESWPSADKPIEEAFTPPASW
jgi:hypothetical protein